MKAIARTNLPDSEKEVDASKPCQVVVRAGAESFSNPQRILSAGRSSRANFEEESTTVNAEMRATISHGSPRYRDCQDTRRIP